MTPTMEEVAGWLREAGTGEEIRYLKSGSSIKAAYESGKVWYDRAAQVEAMGWLPIEEAQRSIEYRCLLCNGITVVIGYWDSSRWINERSPFRSTYPATHFMPLPQPPVMKK